MTGYGNDPCRRCLKTESWPSLDQEMWSRATQPQADIFMNLVLRPIGALQRGTRTAAATAGG